MFAVGAPMLKRHASWLAGTCAACFSMAAFACGDPETLLGSERFSVGPDAPLLLRIDQNGTDLVIAVDNDAGTTLFNHPDDRNGFELVYLQGADGTTQDVCVHSAFRNPDIRNPYQITRLDTSGWNSATLESLQRFSAASRLWANGNPATRAQALQEYEALSTLEFPFRDTAQLYAIRAALMEGRYDTALQYIDAFPIGSELNTLYPHVLPWYRGFALLRQRKLEEAVVQLGQAAAVSTQPLDTAEVHSLRGEALLGLDRDAEGASEIDKALAASGSDHSVLARVHNNLGYVLIKRAFAGNLDPAESRQRLRASIDQHLLARAFAVNAGEITEQMSIDNNLGILYERVSELRKSQYHYREALRLTETAGDVYSLRLLFQNLGALNQRLGDYPKSRAYLEQAVGIAEQSGESTAFRGHCILGTTYRLMGDVAQALAIHESCRALSAEHNDFQTLIEALTELAEDYTQAERTDADAGATGNANAQAAWFAIDAARALLDQHMADVLAAGRTATAALDARADNLCTAQQAPAADTAPVVTEAFLFVATRVLNQHALLARRFGMEEQALEDLRLAAGILDKTRITGQLYTLETGLDVYRALGNKAFACGERALTLVERMHEDLEAERNGPAWSAKTHEIYVALADMLLEDTTSATSAIAGDDAARAAFAVAESAMGISLRQHLSLPPTDTRASEDAQLRAALNTLADRQAALSAEQRARLLPVSYYHQQDLMERSRQNEQDRVAIPPALQSAAIQSRLGAGQAVLYYYIGATDAWLFELDAGHFSVHKLGPAAQLATLLAAVEQDLRSANGAPAGGLRALSAFLLPANLQLTGARELLIVPHRDLYKIPFAALARESAQNPRALIEDFTVKTTPSLTAYFMDKPAAPDIHSADIAVFADPLFNTADLRGAAAEEEPEALQSWSASLERLPYTELEANSLKAVFQPENTLDFLGNRATLANLSDAPARNARILHIATHGYFHSTSSDNVGLVLSAINERNERVPGFVTLTELFGHRFNNELVVISDCDTAMGMQLAGEGMMGVTRGFLAQGARHVISTLWPVSDRASARFMALFYENLRSTGSVTGALQAAQQQLKALPEFRHPYYWAPYVLATVSPVDEMRFSTDVALGR